MMEFTSTVTLKFDINNHEAESEREYIAKLKEQYAECYGLFVKDHEITNIQCYDI